MNKYETLKAAKMVYEKAEKYVAEAKINANPAYLILEEAEEALDKAAEAMGKAEEAMGKVPDKYREPESAFDPLHLGPLPSRSRL